MKPGDEQHDLWREWGRLLEEARADAGDSATDAAKKVKVSKSMWGMYEKGGRRVYDKWVVPNPRSKQMRSIERTYGVHIDTERGTAWREDRPDTGSAAEGPGAYSGDPSQLAGILAELNQTVGELRDEVRRLNQQRGEDEDQAQSLDDAEGSP